MAHSESPGRTVTRGASAVRPGERSPVDGEGRGAVLADPLEELDEEPSEPDDPDDELDELEESLEPDEPDPPEEERESVR